MRIHARGNSLANETLASDSSLKSCVVEENCNAMIYMKVKVGAISSWPPVALYIETLPTDEGFNM